MLYSIGASYNTDMSQYNRQIKRQLAGVDGLSFAYRLNQWGPKVGPPMIPANIAGPFTWIEKMLGIQSVPDILKNAKDKLSEDANLLPGLLTQITNLLTQLRPYDNSSKLAIKNRAQALQSQATGFAGVVNNWETTTQMILGAILSAQADSNTTQDQALALAEKVNSAHDQISALISGVKQLGKDTVNLLSDAGASSSIVESVQSTIAGSVSTLTWIVGGSLAAYFLLPSFLPRLAGGIRKSI